VEAEVEAGLQYFRTYTNRSLIYLAVTWKRISTNLVYLGVDSARKYIFSESLPLTEFPGEQLENI
jgi:hypothetical protein